MDHSTHSEKSSILPLHPAVVERMFYREEEWEKHYRPQAQAGKPLDSRPDLGTTVAHVLRFLKPMFDAKFALDLGTGLGYSARVLADIVGPGGRVLTVERDESLAKSARENLKSESMDRRVAIIMGEAADILNDLSGPFDLIVLDIDKNEYLDLLDRLVELLVPGGHLVVDDAGFMSRGFEPQHHYLTVHMARFVHALLRREDMDSIYLPIGDGVVISRKLRTEPDNQLTLDVASEAGQKDDREKPAREESRRARAEDAPPGQQPRREKKPEKRKPTPFRFPRVSERGLETGEDGRDDE